MKEKPAPKLPIFKTLFWVCLFLLTACENSPRALNANESVIFFPTVAAATHEPTITIDISAWVFEEEKRPLFEPALMTYLSVNPATLSPETKDRLKERTRYFRVDRKRHKKIAARVGNTVYPLPPTRANGRTLGKIAVAQNHIQWQDNGVGRVFYTLETPNHAAHGLYGNVWVLPPDGLFVVSDIDDTIKKSSVLDKKALIRNTFMEPFAAVEGMAAWYQAMAQNPKVFFHYLSASPTPLYPALMDFLTTEKFPIGVLRLREASLREIALTKEDDLTAHKTTVLKRLLSDFPKRQFILVGDSGESDPEIYADFARHNPGHVKAIYIRDVTGEDRSAARYARTFAGIPSNTWHIFTTPPKDNVF